MADPGGLLGRRAPEPPFKPENLLDAFMGDRDAARSIVGRFIERTGDQLRDLPAVHERKDWETARREAHLLKGSAGTISAPELGALAARLEKAYQYQSFQSAAEVLLKLGPAFVRFREAVEAWLREDPAGPP